MGALEEFHDLVSSLDATERAELDTLLQVELNALWLPDPDNKPQVAAVVSEADLLLFGGQAGGGKLSPLDSKVLTPFGWTEIGKLKVGSRVCATDGTVTEIIGVYPQGVRDIYRVTTSDGGSMECGLEHNWLAWVSHHSRKMGNERVHGEASAGKYTTAQIMGEMNRKRRFAIPVCGPVAFNVSGALKGPGNFIQRPIDPYFLGLLLGDGTISRNKGVRVTSADDEILNYVAKLHGAAIDNPQKPYARSARLRGDGLTVTVKALSELGLLGRYSHDKFIPRQYLFAPTDVRWALLQGLMDTDGWAEPKRGCYYATISRRLADDVTHLARSIGAIVSETSKIPKYRYKGKKRTGQRAFTLRIKIRSPINLFRLERKRVIALLIEHQSHGRYIKKIEFSRRAEAVCIQVRHASSLYIADDFIVTHNSDLLCGLALTEHHRSVIFRNQHKDLATIEERIISLAGRKGWNSQRATYRARGRVIELAHLEKPGSEESWQGRPHDFIGFDEGAQLARKKVQFVMGWLRSDKKGQRKRVVIASNPPVTSDGLWLVEWFAPWLDETFPNPAKPGELRWAATARDKEGTTIWLPDGRLIYMTGEREYRYATEEEIAAKAREPNVVEPMTRTFIPSKLSDNKYLAETGYRAQLQSLPEPLRSQLLSGDFMAGRQDDEWQVIPTAWVKAAQARWTPQPPADSVMSAVAADVAQGGADKSVIAHRYGPWYGSLLTKPGIETPKPSDVAGLVVTVRRDAAVVIVDMGGGYGGGVKERLNDNEIDVRAYLGAATSDERSADKQLTFFNKRAESHWRLREALDPDQVGGSKIALPPDPELLGDLTAIRWWLAGTRGVQVEDKEELKKPERLGRSPDKGDAVIMCWSEGERGLVAAQRKRGRLPLPALPSVPQHEREPGTGWLGR